MDFTCSASTIHGSQFWGSFPKLKGKSEKIPFFVFYSSPSLGMWSSYITLAILIGSVGCVFRRCFSRRLPLPPGPKPLPLIGNLHQLPRKDLLREYHRWSSIYGPIIYMHIVGRQFIILNSLKVIVDLFEKRSSIYSTRPRLVMAGELVGRDDTSVLFLKYGSRLKACRQIMHNWMGPKAVAKVYPQQDQGANLLLANLLETPEKFSRHIRANAGSLVLKFGYGIQCAGSEDPWILMSEELSKITSTASQPGRWLVDSLPFLRYLPRWIPGTKFLEYAEASRRVNMNVLRLPFERVKDQIREGTAQPSWTSNALLADGVAEMTPDQLYALQVSAGSLYAGGIETVVATIRTFILMMARHPEVQRKAQAEIDSVVGIRRLPNINDKEQLPFVGQVIKEVYRINPVAPLVPHSLDIDDVYEGYRIPKGAWVMANMWAVFHDPEAYSEPDTFNPERFLETPTHQAEMDPTPLAFGVGRRFCPGYHFALSFVFLNVAQILSVFDICPMVDKEGRELVPPPKFDLGHLSIPSEFDCSIKPRSAEKASLVQDIVATLQPAQPPAN
ncbi:hypothetical protein GALMADRAFT_157349 [Galerina marginata CBS 339.88]|uniref:Cytochrome P450 n=1 Tax=Galerina marginata (strain CBS 339.88) TaxID=685588 RepID=A0A067SUZ0_GALM3|nr:hypothetical protein GALMADRAFT_157349 [Galerina marginata CBS 339.88]